MMKWIFLTLASFTLLSCAALKEQHRKSCASKNWEQVGREDALAGKNGVSKELQECMTETQSPPNRSGYDKGFAEGLKQFCTQEYGLYFGREGKTYSNTCPSSIANSFLAGYSQGKMEYEKLQVAKTNAAALQNLTRPKNSKPPAIKCSFNSDCQVQSKCETSSQSVMGRTCAGTNDMCTFDSDCNLQGRCERSLCVWL